MVWRKPSYRSWRLKSDGAVNLTSVKCTRFCMVVGRQWHRVPILCWVWLRLMLGGHGRRCAACPHRTFLRGTINPCPRGPRRWQTKSGLAQASDVWCSCLGVCGLCDAFGRCSSGSSKCQRELWVRAHGITRGSCPTSIETDNH